MKLQIESSLQYNDFEDILTGVITVPVPFAADATNDQMKEFYASQKYYKQAKGLAVTLITTSVEEEPLQLILMLSTARETWSKRQLSYEQRCE